MMKIVSLNLAGFKDWEVRQSHIVDFLDRQQADVVLLQEVKFDPRHSVLNQAMQINQQLTRQFPYSQSTVSKFYQPSTGEAFREGLAILSRLPIANSEALVLVKQADDKHPRIVQNVELQLVDRKLDLTNIHLSNNQYAKEQLRELLNLLENRGKRAIIAGDFNIFDLDAERSLFETDYTSSTAFRQYKSFLSEGITLDYVLLPKPYSFQSLELIAGLSDHSALSFEVDIS